MNQTNQYLQDLLHWCQQIEMDWRTWMSYEAGYRQEAYDFMEKELQELMAGIKAVQKMEQSSQKEAGIAELKQRSEKLYQALLAALKEKQVIQKREQPALSPQQDLRVDHLSRAAEDGLPRPVPIGQHRLPPLPYSYHALEPYISEEIMRLHHDIHHQNYVDGLNRAEKEMAKARQTGDFELIKHWEREAAFHGAGHYLHTIFWNIMSPKGGGEPTGELAAQINASFGSFEAFKQHFSEAAKAVEGVGWAILVWSPRSHRLEILQAERHQFLSQWDVIPLLVLDVWEHAYYLQYKTEKGDYIENWWNIVDWKAVERRYDQARQVMWSPF